MTSVVLLCHAGTHPLVPEIELVETVLRRGYPNSFYPESDGTKKGLILHKPSDAKDGGMFEYRQLFSEFIHNPARSGRYAFDGRAYARAAAYCIQLVYQLSDLTIEDGLTADKGPLPSEDLLSSTLRLDNGKWTWSTRFCGRCLALHVCDGEDDILDPACEDGDNVELIFLSLGYLAYLLPFSWRYDTLIQQCQQESFARGLAGWIFPARTRQACQQMEAYLQRMGYNIGLYDIS